MDFPCKHCDKADTRKETNPKCDKPCRQYKEWYKCCKNMIDFLSGKIRL